MPNKDQGFTLVELLITISLIAIISSMAMPALADLIAYNRQQALLTQVQDAIQKARSKAVLHRQTVVLCGSSDATSCSSDWSKGSLTLLEENQEVLDVTQLPTTDELCWSGFCNRRIHIYDNGTSPLSKGRYNQCHNQVVAWQLILSRQGRLKQGTSADNASRASL